MCLMFTILTLCTLVDRESVSARVSALKQVDRQPAKWLMGLVLNVPKRLVTP